LREGAEAPTEPAKSPSTAGKRKSAVSLAGAVPSQ
jgi:hypothetical protein